MIPFTRRFTLWLAATIAVALFTAGAAQAGKVTLVAPDFIREIPEHEHDKGDVVNGIEAIYPRGSWKVKHANAGSPNHPVVMDIALLTPRGRAVHEVVSRIRSRGYAIPADLEPERFNNGFQITGVHDFPGWQGENDWLEITGVQCRLSNDSLVNPISTRLDSVRVDGFGNNKRYTEINAVFPLWLLESNEELKFVFYFKRHSPKYVRFSAGLVRGLH
ncbi:MAG: hypothetical protein AB1752_09890 [Candidatus Zixiibacteriota bacterium]